MDPTKIGTAYVFVFFSPRPFQWWFEFVVALMVFWGINISCTYLYWGSNPAVIDAGGSCGVVRGAGSCHQCNPLAVSVHVSAAFVFVAATSAVVAVVSAVTASTAVVCL